MSIEPILDIRHERIISEIEKISKDKEVLVVGAGDCKKDYHLIKKGYKVYSTDYQRSSVFDKKMKPYFDTLDFHISNIFDVNSFPTKQSEVVLCCEVLEHLKDYKIALENLLTLTSKRLIVTVPWRHSFNDPSPPPEGHCNHWDDNETPTYKSIYEFEKLCHPNKVYVEKILTKERDLQMNQRSYLIIIDKV